jgi:CBS domain-containing protein
VLTGEVLGVQRPITLPASATVREAAALMRDRDIGDVLVMDDSGALTGIVTDRDVVIRVVAQGADPDKATLADACTRDPVTIEATDSVDDAAAVMREHALRRLPVVAGGAAKVRGVISLGDVAMQGERNGAESVLADISRAPANG